MERRLLPCIKCGRLVPIRSKGMCPACRYDAMVKSKMNEGGRDASGLAAFFDRHISILSNNPVSITGERIYGKPSRANVCHLYPKRKYKSVAMDDTNVVYMTVEEHQELDNMLDCMDIEKVERRFGAAGAIILGRMASLLPYVKENGKLKNHIMAWKNRLRERRIY